MYIKKTTTKAEKIITKHIESMNGLTNPAIACDSTPYTFKTCKRIFKKIAICRGNGFYFLRTDMK